MASKIRDNPLQIFAVIAVKSLIFTILWIPVYIFRFLLAYFISKCNPNFGKILDRFDSRVEENYSDEPPKASLIFTLVLDAPLKLNELQLLFTRNVLEAKIQIKKGVDDLRYPEYKQYQTDIAGYRFWKDDPTFNINNHIIELPYNAKFDNMSKLHTEMTNKVYSKQKSPWDIILVNNYKNDANKALLIYRCHHTLGDAKSALKVLVENLGRKQLSLPNVQYKASTFLDEIKYYALMPFYFVYSQVFSYVVLKATDNCSLKYKGEDHETLLSVGISRPASMNDIKMIAKKNNVTTSAVVMAAVAGGVAKSDGSLAKKGLPCKWVLPKPDHPDKLANHSYSGVIHLPTDITSPLARLKKCQEIFMYLKSSDLHKYDQSVLFQTGTWFNPLRKQWLKTTFPLTATNIAGEGQGFSIGSCPVSQFTMTCAPFPGACGVIICGFSYKDVIELSATAKNGVLNESQTQQLADLMQQEFQLLRDMST